MKKISDIAFKLTSGALGATTIVAGIWLGASMFKGFVDVKRRQVRNAEGNG